MNFSVKIFVPWNSFLFIFLFYKKIYIRKFKIATTARFVKEKKNEGYWRQYKVPRSLRLASKEFVGMVKDAKVGNGKLEGEKVAKVDKLGAKSDLCEYNKHICIICFQNSVNSMYWPCQHGGLCRSCAITNYLNLKKCPLCRNEIHHIIVYEKRKCNQKEKRDGKEENEVEEQEEKEELYQVEQYPDEVIEGMPVSL